MNEVSITILPDKMTISATSGESLLTALRRYGLAPDAPCNGKGTCGKCLVQMETADGLFSVRSCETPVSENLTVILSKPTAQVRILTEGCQQRIPMEPVAPGHLLAFDIGTTTVVCFLLHGKTGQELATASMLNPQVSYGADVVSRIQSARQGEAEALAADIRQCMETLIKQVCQQAEISAAEIGVVSVVANPCMQQLFLGLPVDNLVQIPFFPVLTHAEMWSASSYLPSCCNAKLLIVPDISGYIGADTLACVLSTSLQNASKPVLLVDIGTNGEMVLGDRNQLVACSTAAGPALEGARIRFGMRGTTGAIDRVWFEDDVIKYHVIGDCEPSGVCGSGLLDAMAIMLQYGGIDRRGKLQPEGPLSRHIRTCDGQYAFFLTDFIYLTQEDIREFQLAKGAIAAGIALMIDDLHLSIDDISEVLLAGAFGSYLRPESACITGLLPRQLLNRIRVVGNAAGSGAKMIACSKTVFLETESLVQQIRSLELASLPGFRKSFAKHMMFEVP